jgi:hypothetical protein
MLDYARSNAPLVSQAQSFIPKNTACVATVGLSRSQIAALQFHGGWPLKPLTRDSVCEWLIADLAWGGVTSRKPIEPNAWQWRTTIGHPAERKASLMVYERRRAP